MTAPFTTASPLIESYGDRRVWVNWRREKNKQGEWTKVPYRPNGRKAKSDNPATWATLDVVQRVAEKFDGIGIMFDDTLLGVDLDHCVNAAGGITDAASLRFIEAANSYAEISPGEDGVHGFLIVSDSLKLQRNRSGNYEAYTCGRFFTVTGKPYGEVKPIRTVSAFEAVALLRLIGYPWEKEAGTSTNGKHPPTDAPPTDNELIELIRKSKQAAKFNQLFSGDTTGYSSPSEADMALCCTLAFWTRDAAQLERIWLSSTLGQRDKTAQREDYRRRTVDGALATVTEQYEPRAHRNGHSGANMNDAPGDDDAPLDLLSFDADDSGNADAIAAVTRNEFLTNDAYGVMRWTGTHFESEGAEAKLTEDAKAVLRQRRFAAIATGTKNEPVVKAALPSARHVRDAISLFKPMRFEPARNFDCDPDVLNVANGVVDLRTGEVVAHETSQRFTNVLNTEYDADADPSVFASWLAGEVEHPEEVIPWLQKWLGYCLTGRTNLEKLLFIHGPGRGGKGTFTETVATLMGGLAKTLAFESLVGVRAGNDQHFEFAPLHAARLVVTDEGSKEVELNAARIKKLTGGNEINCSFKNKTPFAFRPKFKLWLVSNHALSIDVDDDAAWARLGLIHFPNSYIGREDVGLKQRMREPEVLRGLLAWMVQGARQYYAAGAKGLPNPECARGAIAARRDELDQVKNWLNDRTESGDWLVTGGAWGDYNDWCRANGVTPKKMKGFSQSLIKKGYELGRNPVGHRCIIGLRFRHDNAPMGGGGF